MQMSRGGSAVRLVVAVVVCTMSLVAIVSTAPLPPATRFVAGAEVAVQELESPFLSAIRSGNNWILDPHDVPKILTSQTQTLRGWIQAKLRLSSVKITSSSKGVHIRNSGSSTQLVRFGAKDLVYIVRPRTTEIIRGLTPHQLRSVSIHPVPHDHPFRYFE